MGLFIKLEINGESCLGLGDCGKCVAVCPVRAFAEGRGLPLANEKNEDECTLCDLCLDACEPGAITVRRVYEESATPPQAAGH